MTTGFRGARLSRPLLLGVLVHDAAPADDEILGVLLLPLGRFVAALPDASHDVLGRGPGHIELLALLGRGQETHHDDEFGHAILLLTGPDRCDSDTRLKASCAYWRVPLLAAAALSISARINFY